MAREENDAFLKRKDNPLSDAGPSPVTRGGTASCRSSRPAKSELVVFDGAEEKSQRYGTSRGPSACHSLVKRDELEPKCPEFD
jgi:hypothetical protein